MLQGLGIFGRTGAGKTNVVYALIEQLYLIGVPFLFLDWKRTIRHLLPQLPGQVAVYTPGRELAPLRFNPLIPPPGTEAAVHQSQLVDAIAAAYTLGDGARSLVHRALRDSYEATDNWPTISQVVERLEASDAGGRQLGWKATALRALRALSLAGLFDDAKASRHGITPALFTRSTIVELDGIDDNAKRFLVPLLVSWLFAYRLQARDRERLKMVLIIEEAHHLLYRQEVRSRETVLNTFLRQCRELGVGVIVVDQHPHLVSSAGLGSYGTICLNLKEPTDAARAAAMCQLQGDDRRYLGLLPVGQGIVKLQDRWARPFLVQFRKVAHEKGRMIDTELRRHLANQAPWQETSRNTAGGSPPLVPVESAVLKLLQDCAIHPRDGVNQRYVRLGWSAGRGERLKRQLLAAGLAAARWVRHGQTRRLILAPTLRAQKLLRIGGRQTPASMEHEFWKHYYAGLFKENGYEVEVEAVRVGGRVDVLARKGAEQIGLEVETGMSDVVRNVGNCLRSGFTMILVIATDTASLRRVEERVARAGLLVHGRVRIAFKDDYVP